MIGTPPQAWDAWYPLVWMLGCKHGLDADHIAAIDGLTRVHAAAGKRVAAYCGALFATGHGVVVLLLAVLVTIIGAQWTTPAWLAPIGALVSSIALILLGVLNLRSVLTTDAGAVVIPVTRRFTRFGWLRAPRPWSAAVLGALFALSLDTVSQVTLFAGAGMQSGGLGHALGLSGVFVLGMWVADLCCGLWISRLLARADQWALVASRVMGVAVALLSFLVAALRGITGLRPALTAPIDGGITAGVLVLVLALMGLAYLLAWWFARRAPVYGACGVNTRVR